MMKKFLPLLLVILGVIFGNIIIIVNEGVAPITQQEMIETLASGKVVGCPTQYGGGKERWINLADGGIFKTSFVLFTHKYHFSGGGLIPNKYNHLIEKKLAEGCK